MSVTLFFTLLGLSLMSGFIMQDSEIDVVHRSFRNWVAGRTLGIEGDFADHVEKLLGGGITRKDERFLVWAEGSLD